MTRKSFTGALVKAGAEGRVEAVISTFSVLDKDGDVVLPGAITDGQEVVISAYGHTSHGGALPVGKGVIRTTNTEAILHGQFFLSTTAGRDTFEVVKNLGALQEWSYSLHNVRGYQGTHDGQPANFIESVFVKEASPVLIGASIGTRTLSAKSKAELDEAERELMRFIRSTTEGGVL
jgi:hypothetical protein